MANMEQANLNGAILNTSQVFYLNTDVSGCIVYNSSYVTSAANRPAKTLYTAPFANIENRSHKPENKIT